MFYLLLTLIIIACAGLIGIVLIQNPKGGGISSNFGALNQIGGVKQTTEGVEKITWGLAIFLVVLCLLTTPYMKGGKSVDQVNPESSVQVANPGTMNMPKPATPPAGASGDNK